MTIFPVTESTLSANHVGQFLQERYYLSEMTTCKLFRTGMNHLYVIADEEEKFVFRVYTFNWRTKLDIDEELRLLIHLKQNNAPTSYPIADKSNELIQEFNSPEGKRYGVLFSFAAGTKTARFTPETSYFIGQALAKIHKSTEGFLLNRVTYDTQVLLKDSIDRIKKFFDKPSSEIKFLEQAAIFLLSEFKKQTALNLDMALYILTSGLTTCILTEKTKSQFLTLISAVMGGYVSTSHTFCFNYTALTKTTRNTKLRLTVFWKDTRR